MGLERLASGALRSSRYRHRQQQMYCGVEDVSNRDVEMRCKREDQKMGNPVRQAVYEIAVKARRIRNRIHHQSTESFHIDIDDDKVDAIKSFEGTGANFSHTSAKGPCSGNEDFNKIRHQRSQPTFEPRDIHRSGSSVGVDANGHSNFKFPHDVPDHWFCHCAHNPSPQSSAVISGLSANQEVREDSILGFSVKSIDSSSGEQSYRSQQSSGTHRCSHDRDDQSPSSQPRSSRSSYLVRDSSGQLSLRNYYSGSERDYLHSYRSHQLPVEHSNYSHDASLSQRGTKVSQTWFAATELQSNLLVEVSDYKFHLHKFPLLSRSGRLNRLVFESRDTNNDHIKLHDMPGGPEAFELAIKFCYGIPIEFTPLNIAALRCAAEFLEMTDSLEDGNLVSKTEHYLSVVVLTSWKDSITVLQSCEALLPWAEELQIVRRCSESVAWKACTDPHGIRWSFSNDPSAISVVWDGPNQMQVNKNIPHDWWVEDIIQLNLDAFSMVVMAIKAKGTAYTLVGSAIAQYATKWLPGLEKRSRKHLDASKDIAVPHEPGINPQLTGKEIVLREAQDAVLQNQAQRKVLVEGLVKILPPQLDAVSCSFLLRLLRVACLLNVEAWCRSELERRAGMQLERASLSDLLIPSRQSSSETLYDTDVVQRILEHYLLKDNSAATSPPRNVSTEKQLNLFENGSNKPPTAPHTTSIRVAKLMEAYLAEVARDINLSLARFQSLAESMPEFPREFDDGLYRAIDTYLKAHPTMTEHERKKLCRVMDCQRLSLEACLHAAKNERLPLRVVVQVMFSEQVKLRHTVTGNAPVRKDRENSAHSSARGESHPTMSKHLITTQENSNAGGLSLQENWQSARQEIDALKQEIERMRTKFIKLEHDYSGMTQQVEKLSKSKSLSTSGWTSGWRKFSSHMKHPNIFGLSKNDFDYHKKDDESFTLNSMSTPPNEQSTPTAAGAEQRRRSHSVTSASPAQRWRRSVS